MCLDTVNVDTVEEHQHKKQKNIYTSYPNDDTTRYSFNFINDGNKHMRNGIYRKYYCCTSRDVGCPAKYCVDHLPGGNKITTYKPFPHDHEPPSNPCLRSDVHQVQLAAGAKSSVIHRNLVNEAPLPLSTANVPTRVQLHNWKYQLSIKDLPSGNK